MATAKLLRPLLKLLMYINDAWPAYGHANPSGNKNMRIIPYSGIACYDIAVTIVILKNQPQEQQK